MMNFQHLKMERNKKMILTIMLTQILETRTLINLQRRNSSSLKAKELQCEKVKDKRLSLHRQLLMTTKMIITMRNMMKNTIMRKASNPLIDLKEAGCINILTK